LLILILININNS